MLSRIQLKTILVYLLMQATGFLFARGQYRRPDDRNTAKRAYEKN